MNREEAIRYCDEYLARHISDIDKEFLKIAKEALQQEPCDKCVYSTSEGCQYDDITKTIPPFDNNLISRNAVLDLVNADWKYEGLEEPINSLPSVNPQNPICPSAGVDCEDCPAYEPKTGHWILKRTFPTKLYDEYLNEYKCSECYREIRCTESQLVNYPYCHCGAKMSEIPTGSEGSNKE